MKAQSLLKSSRGFIAIAFIAVALLVSASAQAQLYSDVTNFTGQGYASGGAASVGGTITTTMVADDLTVANGGALQPVTGFTFSVANFNSTTVSARSLVRFYANNGSSGGPGTLLASFNFNPIAFAAGSVATFNFTPGIPLFIVPASGTIWAGVAFDNLGTTATAAQLNKLGQGLFNPPTIGSSSDEFFQSSTASALTSNNPSGTFQFFGGNPVANFGWILNGNPVAAVPDHGTTLFLLVLGFAGLAAVRRRSLRSLN